MSRCQGSSVLDETSTGVELFPTLPTRFLCKSLLCIFFIALAFITSGMYWVMAHCQIQPGMTLETLSVHNMTAYQTNATGTTRWQVDSSFNIGLSMWNPNTVSACFTTYSRVQVRVAYRGKTILREEVWLGFGLRSQTARPVMMKVEGKSLSFREGRLWKVMEEDVRNGNVPLTVYLSARYRRNDRKEGWVNLNCMVVVPSPSNSSSSSIDKICY